MDTIFDTKHLYRTYFKMALPVVLGLVVTLIYNLADTFFIGTDKRHRTNCRCLCLFSCFYHTDGIWQYIWSGWKLPNLTSSWSK